MELICSNFFYKWWYIIKQQVPKARNVAKGDRESQNFLAKLNFDIKEAIKIAKLISFAPARLRTDNQDNILYSFEKRWNELHEGKY